MARSTSPFERSFTEWQRLHPTHVEHHGKALHELFTAGSGLHISSAVEWFAGLGVASQVIRDTWPGLVRHIMVDKSADCAEVLLRKFAGKLGVLVYCADARTLHPWPAGAHSLVCLDWNTWTVLHWEKWWTELEMIFRWQPAVVQLTDTAVNKLHFHHQTYEDIMSAPCRTPMDYLTALSQWFYTHHGYSIRWAVYYHVAAYMLLLPGEQEAEIWKLGQRELLQPDAGRILPATLKSPT